MCTRCISMIPNGVIGVSEVKNSIFQLWSGIVLGWVKWPKNALRGRGFRFYDGPPVYPGLQPGYPVGHQNRILATIHWLVRRERRRQSTRLDSELPSSEAGAGVFERQRPEAHVVN